MVKWGRIISAAQPSPRWVSGAWGEGVVLLWASSPSIFFCFSWLPRAGGLSTLLQQANDSRKWNLVCVGGSNE